MVTRRRFLEAAAMAGLASPLREQAAPATASVTYPVRFRKAAPWDALARYLEPGQDEFTVEKEAAGITAHLDRLLELRELPLSPEFQGASPMPVRHKPVSDGVFEAEFNPDDQDFRSGLQRWVTSLGQIRSARFFVLPGGRV